MIKPVKKNKYKGINTFYAKVPDPKKKTKSGETVYHYFSLGTTNKTEANRLIEEGIKNGTFEIKDEKETITLAECAIKFENYQRSKGTKKGSINTMFQAVNMLKPIFDKRMAEIKNQDIAEAWQQTSDNIAPMTYRNRKIILSTFFSYLVDVLEVYPRNPIRKAIPRRKVPKKRKDFWTIEQIDRIIANAPNDKTRLLWSFMAFAGLRKSEAMAMRPEKIYGNKIHLVGKGDKEASIPICPRLQREIDRYKGEWHFYFNAHVLRRVAAKAIPEGFPGKATAHRFRHSFGSNLLRANANVNIRTVSELMRHESVALTLETYMHILDSDAEKAVNEVYK